MLLLFSHPVVSDSLWFHGLQHARPPCPSPSPGVGSNDAVQPSHLLLLPSSLALNLSHHQGLFQWVGSLHHVAKIIGASASASAPVLPMNIQCLFPLRLASLISLLSKELSRVFSSTTVQKHQFFSAQPSLWSTSHIHTWLLEKPYFDYKTLYSK